MVDLVDFMNLDMTYRTRNINGDDDTYIKYKRVKTEDNTRIL